VDQRVESYLPLHPDTFRILVILGEGERHGYAVVKELETDGSRPGRIMPANLYRRIRTMRDNGLIEETEGDVDPDLDDKRRKYFRVTTLGRDVARAEAARLKSLVDRAAGLLVP
jgi:DNA-binding PadR family transcriptional regulator